MRITHVLKSHGDVMGYLEALWKSDRFKSSWQAQGFVYRLSESYAWLPRLIGEMTNDRLERAHFSTWWNVLMTRDDYSNPIIHDLYYLHEIAHAASMPYAGIIGQAAFDEKMQRNELEASVLSEIQVYFEMPGLRECSFPHQIFADRFLKDEVMTTLWKSNPKVAVETMRTIRRDIMVSKPEHLMDFTERWIRRFAEQNVAHGIAWRDRYHEVERAMSQLQLLSAKDRGDAIWHHVDWLEADASHDTVDHIPFREQAELFTPFYWANKHAYDRDAADEQRRLLAMAKEQ